MEQSGKKAKGKGRAVGEQDGGEKKEPAKLAWPLVFSRQPATWVRYWQLEALESRCWHSFYTKVHRRAKGEKQGKERATLPSGWAEPCIAD